MVDPIDPADLRTQQLVRDAAEDLQRERLMAFWRQWGSTIIGMAIMLVVGTAAGVLWREWQQSRNEKSTAVLAQVVDSYVVPTPEQVAGMRPDHAAIAYLAMAGTVLNDDINKSKSEAERKEALADLYGKAANIGDDGVWAWLGRWNELRLKMDDQSLDAEALLKDYEALANDMKKSSLVALAWIDAALIAGERLKDPARALTYIEKAEAIVPRGTTVSTITSDLAHLYAIRKQAVEPAPQATPEAKQ